MIGCASIRGLYTRLLPTPYGLPATLYYLPPTLYYLLPYPLPPTLYYLPPYHLPPSPLPYFCRKKIVMGTPVKSKCWRS